MTQHPKTFPGWLLPISMRRLVNYSHFLPPLVLIYNLQHCVVKRRDFVLAGIIQVSQGPEQPTLHRAQYSAPKGQIMSVIVKIYPPHTNYKKKADLHRLIPIWSVLCSICYSTHLRSIQAFTHAFSHWPVWHHRSFSISGYIRLWVNINCSPATSRISS